MLPSETIPLPPATAPAALRGEEALPGPARRRAPALGWLLGLFAAGFAFLLASFPAGNADLWLRLAAGRHLLGGTDPFGPLPGLPADLQVNHTWLFNLVCYALYSGLGGTALVVAKALLVAGLALLLFRLARPAHGVWLAAACTTLALLAMGTRLPLHPATVSCFLLALTLWLLPGMRNGEWGMGNEKPASSAFPIPHSPFLILLFVLWANLDRWFVLGLGVVALAGLGKVVDAAQKEARSASEAAKEARSASGAAVQVLALVLLAAVCFLNPAFRLSGLDYYLTPVRDPGTSPFQVEYLTSALFNPAALAFYPLLALGAVSFLLAWRHGSWQRFLPWVGLAAFAGLDLRVVPFFAVVAGPLLARNLQDFLDDQLARRPAQWRRLAVTGHGLAALLGPVLLVCAWPGWLQGGPYEPRRWAVEVSPSLQQGAATVTAWRNAGKLGPDDRGLYLSRETAAAFAWFCPEENGLLDHDLVAAVRGETDAPADMAGRLRAAGINHLILYDEDRDRLFATLGRLLAAPDEWPVLSLEGKLVVFGWRDPARAGQDPFGGWRLDLERLAFHPPQGARVPAEGPAAETQERFWWEAFWKPLPPRSVDGDLATLYLFQAEALRRGAAYRHLRVWEASQSAGVVAAAGSWSGPGGLLDACRRLTLLRPLSPQEAGPAGLPPLDRSVYWFQQQFTMARDDVPPALLYLAVRAARRALATHPDDAQAHLVLGESYVRLLHGTRERVWSQRLPELGQLRLAQASTALNQAVLLKPDFAQAHLALGTLYQNHGYLDLALKHLQTYLDLAGRAGPPAGSDPKDFRQERARWQQGLDQLAGQVQKLESEYRTTSPGLPVLDRALLAMRKGLAGKALDLLLESHVTAFGPRGMELELRLLLGTGQAQKVRDWTDPENRGELGLATYHVFRAVAQAALGEYAAAGDECAQLIRSLDLNFPAQPLLGLRVQLALGIAHTVLDHQPEQGSLRWLLRRVHRQDELARQLRTVSLALRRGADLYVLRGLILFEEGDVGEAELAWREALTLWKDPVGGTASGILDFNGRPVAQQGLAWLE